MKNMMPKECPISINGTELTPAQSMTLRVACTSYLSEMSDDTALGDDAHGRFMVKAYRDRLVEIMRLIMQGCD